MASIRGRTTVFSVTRPVQDTNSKSPENSQSSVPEYPSDLGHIQSLFAARPPQAQPDGDNPRSQKRRKLNHDDHYRLEKQSTEEDQSILLSKVVIDLDMPLPLNSNNSIYNSEFTGNLQRPLLVVLESFKAGNDAFQIQLRSSETGEAVILKTNTPEEHFTQSATPILRTALDLASADRTKKNRSVVRAAYSRCLLVPPATGTTTYSLEVELRWLLNLSVVESASVSAKNMKHDLRLLERYFPRTAQIDRALTVADFYDVVHVPRKDLQTSPRIAEVFSDTSLYPFQQRAVDWLLKREGVAISSLGEAQPIVEPAAPLLFRKMENAAGRECYVSHARGMVVSDLSSAIGGGLQSIQGGILAEEMGLGKTLELIALILLNKREQNDGVVFDTYAARNVRLSSATLIITPDTILNQWISEINTHAPQLKVFHYKGLPAQHAPKMEHEAASVENLLRYDVVLTTYNVLSKEIHYATPPPDRPSRTAKRYERRTSPLMEFSWWRVCLDEAQRFESGVSQAARVARMIPRHHAWAVSGTPVRKSAEDLRGLLIFLRCDLFTNSPVWERLDKASFRDIFGHIALRHSKDEIRQELHLPRQRRFVVTIPFTSIEEQHYSNMMHQMCEDCSLTADGQPLDGSRDMSDHMDTGRMRDWLVRLRQTCLHSQVGRKNKTAMGGKDRAHPLDYLLTTMINEHEAKWKSNARDMILVQILRGHIKAYAGSLPDRAEQAMLHYDEALQEAQSHVRSCRDDLKAEQQKLATAKSNNGAAQTNPSQPDLSSDEEKDDEGKDGEDQGRIPILRQTLRSFLELEHACKFFIATSAHQLKENKEAVAEGSLVWHRLDQKETDTYAEAKSIRQELLLTQRNRALAQMHRVESRKPFHQIPKISNFHGLGGIESRKILETIDIISYFMNVQADHIAAWRTKVADVLLERLVDDDDDRETTGLEYDASLVAQDKLYVYMLALRTLVADRSAATHGLRNELVEHEFEFAEKQAQPNGLDKEKNRGHAPELVLEVASLRQDLQASLGSNSLKGIVASIRSLVNGLQWRADGGDARATAELIVMQKYMSNAQDILNQQGKAIVELEKEMLMFRATMNQRLEFYRQFQRISDTVAMYKEQLDKEFDQRAFRVATAKFEQLSDSVAKEKASYLYALNLQNEKPEDVAATKCPICLSLMGKSAGGALMTVCGHKYCTTCIGTWWKDNRNCPLCKKALRGGDFKLIAFNTVPSQVEEYSDEPASSSQASTPGSAFMDIYKNVHAGEMKEIRQIDLPGPSYGTKIDMIARTLLWLRANDNGAKTIIFSQFGDFLSILRQALNKWKIGVSRISDQDGIMKFKTDPSIECFLLDAKTDSSGLNLTNATNVFLCEPLINPAIELQAIARVHRIGQQRSTRVYMFLVKDTVEESIYQISVARRLEHIKSAAKASRTSTPLEQALDKANSTELQAAPVKSLLRNHDEGEQVKEDDVWRCLFQKPRHALKPIESKKVEIVSAFGDDGLVREFHVPVDVTTHQTRVHPDDRLNPQGLVFSIAPTVRYVGEGADDELTEARVENFMANLV